MLSLKVMLFNSYWFVCVCVCVCFSLTTNAVSFSLNPITISFLEGKKPLRKSFEFPFSKAQLIVIVQRQAQEVGIH